MKLAQVIEKLHPRRIPELVQFILTNEAASGKLVILVAAIALFIANSALGAMFASFWSTPLSIGTSNFSISMDLQHWINEGLMTFFFLAVGLEIKREIVKGELRRFKTALLPILAALGGMVVPATVYVLINMGSTHGVQGWAIPIATDIAIALSLLAILGKGIPSSLRLFLLTLAIVDDIGAIIVVAVFYGTSFSLVPLLLAALISVGLILIRKQRWLSPAFYIVPGLILWFLIFKSGVEASIVGALIGMLIPVKDHALGQKSISERIEKFVIPLSSFVVIPLFVLANAGVRFSTATLTDATISIGLGIVGGLVVGKVLGIVGTTWILVKMRIVNLPRDTSWRQIIGVGFIAGIGFTVSLFVAELSFTDDTLTNFAKISVFAGSILSALIGLLILRRGRKARLNS